MGEVWKARDTRLDRIVAIKRLKGEHGARFQQEARAIAALNHPNICQIHDVGPDYFVMEFIEGAPLKGPLEPEETLQLAIQIADALMAAHGAEHSASRLKPGNIMVTASKGRLSCSISAWRSRPTIPTRRARLALIGTPVYISPEQAEGKPLDVRSDIFSFGAVLYELLAGHAAISIALAAVLRDDPPALESAASE